MEDNLSHYREVVIENDEVKKLMERKNEIVEDNRKVFDESQELEKRLNKNNTEIQKIKDKAIPLLDEELKKLELGEYEIFGQSVVEDGVLKVSVMDMVEEMKNKIHKMKKENENTVVYPVSEPSAPEGDASLLGDL